MFSLLNDVISSEFPLGTSDPMKMYEPSVGLSKADRQFRRVVFPDPEGPKRRTLSPSSI